MQQALQFVGDALSTALRTTYNGLLMGMKSQGFLFRNQQYSDADVVVRLPNGTISDSDGEDTNNPRTATTADKSANATTGEEPAGPTVLVKFPGHMAILCQSDYFETQVGFQRDAHEATGSRPTISIIVEDDSHVPAVEAIIAILYGVRGLLAGLEQHQVMHVIQYADMMQLGSVAKEAVQLLVQAVKAKSGLSESVLNILRQLTWSDSMQCMQPLLPALVESVGYNLEAIWETEQRSSKLLKLPLAAVQLLLSSDKLRVYSEDTVMYTAARYVAAQPKEHQQQASEQLSQLVRAPHLSDFQLTAQAANQDQTVFHILQSYKPLLQKLLMLKRLGPVTAADVARLLHTAPQSWQLSTRQNLPPTTTGVKLLWQLPVSEIMTAYDSCTAQKRHVNMYSKSVSAPMSGIAWKLLLQCLWDEAGSGVKVGVYSSPTSCAAVVHATGGAACQL